MWFMESIFFIIVLTIITFFAGQPLLLALSRENRFLDAEKFCLSLLYGTFTISYLFGIGSYCNLPGKYIGPIILLIIFVTTILLRQRLNYEIRIKKLIQFILICLMAAIISFWTLLVYHAYIPFNDTIAYLSISDYLYNHGFLKKYVDHNGFKPLDSLILVMQPTRARMGANFFLAAIQSMGEFKNSIFLFPVAKAWGMILTLSSIVIASRWIFHLRWKYILITLILCTVTFNPIYYSIYYGFYNQIFGCAFFLVSLAAFTRLIQNSNSLSCTRYILINAVFLASLILIYPELAPFAFFALIISLLLAFKRYKLDSKKWILTLLRLGLIILIIANIGLIGFIYYLPEQIKAVAGWHMDFSSLEFISTAFGIMPKRPPNIINLLGIVFILVFCFAIYNLIKKRSLRYSVWFSALAVFLIVYIYFKFFVNDPWMPSSLGHSWNLFKLVTWIYTTLIVGIGYGISKLRWNKIAAPLILIASTSAGLNAEPYYNQTLLSQRLTNSEYPFTAYEQLAAEIKKLKTNLPIELATDQNKILAYYLSPTPVIADWRKDCYLWHLEPKFMNIKVNDKHYVIIDTQACITCNAKQLPANTSLIDSTMPYVKDFIDFYDWESGSGSYWRWSNGKSAIVFNYNKNEKVKIKFNTSFLTIPATLKVLVSGNKLTEILISKAGLNSVELVANLKKGENTLFFSTNVQPIKVPPDTRLLSFSISNLQIAQ